MIRALVVIMAAACGVTAQTDFDLELLGRVRQHMKASVAQLSDYTCQETMERSIYAPTGKIEFRECLRLEVLVTAAGELFAWPGSTGFTSELLNSWIGRGAIGTGSFAVELRNLFLSSNTTVKYVGIETRDKQSLYRFDFHVPLLSSRHTLTVNGRSATTAYSGSFWVNRESLDLVRLEKRVEGIPPDLDCRESHNSVTYGRIRLDVGERLLPTAAELVIVGRNGRESRNSVAFSRCRHYAVETSLSFDKPPSPEAPARQLPQLKLPAGVALVLLLDQPISIDKSAAGDELVARLDKAVTSGGVSLPKGTRVLGRIRRLEQHLSSPASNLIGLQFYAAQAPSGSITFSAHLTGPRSTQDVLVLGPPGNRLETRHGAEGLNIDDPGTSTGVGTFRVQGKNLRLPRGFRTLWETH